MEKITYERHYFGGIIPLIIVIVLFILNLEITILLFIFLLTSLFPYLFITLFLKNTGVSIRESLKVSIGASLIGMGLVFYPEVLNGFVGFIEIHDFLISLMYITVPVLFLIGTLLIFDTFRKELY